MKSLLEATSQALDEARVKLDRRDEKIKEMEEVVKLSTEKQLAAKPGSYSRLRSGTTV